MVPLQDGVSAEQDGRIWRPVPALPLSPSEEKEIAYYRDIRRARGDAGFFDLLTAKADFIRVFQLLADRLDLQPGQTVLEIGAGQGWASCLAKRRQPDCRVVAADIARDALLYAEAYEQLLGVRIDELWACSVRALPFADAQFHRIFAFASLHHFGERHDFSGVLAEVLRLLAPGGRAVFLYESWAPGWAIGWIRRRARRQMKNVVDEDVLHLGHLRSVCHRLGGRLAVEFWPNPSFRDSASAAAYMAVLNRCRVLASLMPGTVNVTITKPAAPEAG